MSNLLALDIGEKRIGIALAAEIAQLPGALTTLSNDADFDNQMGALITQYQPDCLVVGLPRNLSGDDTPQTGYVRAFASHLEATFGKPVIFQDEALTSHKAKEELDARGKPYPKTAIDALSAVYILEDYLKEGR